MDMHQRTWRFSQALHQCRFFLQQLLPSQHKTGVGRAEDQFAACMVGLESQVQGARDSGNTSAFLANVAYASEYLDGLAG